MKIVEQSLDWFSENKYERFWFLIAFIVFIVFVYSVMEISNDNSHRFDDPNANYPSEFEIRGGNTWGD
jgi:hypothetical protein